MSKVRKGLHLRKLHDLSNMYQQELRKPTMGLNPGTDRSTRAEHKVE